jgi:hypothetical protein
MSSKIVNIDPTKRLSQEALDDLKKQVNELTVDNISGFMLSIEKDGDVETSVYGVDLGTLKSIEIHLDDVARHLIYGQELENLLD